MSQISDATYRHWQERLARGGFFRRFWAFWGLYAILLYGAAGVWLLAMSWRNWRALLLAAAAGLLNRYVICEVIHRFRRKPHPYQRLNLNTLGWWLMSWKDHEYDAFPSEHVSTAAAISLVVFLLFPAWGWLLLPLPLLIAPGRVVLAYHEISDVAWALPTGLLSGYLAYVSLYGLLIR